MQADASIRDVKQADAQQHQWRCDAASRCSFILDELRKASLSREGALLEARQRLSHAHAESAVVQQLLLSEVLGLEARDDMTSAAQCRCSVSSAPSPAAPSTAERTHAARRSDSVKAAALAVTQAASCEQLNGTARLAQAEAAMHAGAEAAMHAGVEAAMHAGAEAAMHAELDGALRHAFREACAAAEAAAAANKEKEEAVAAVVKEKEKVVAAVVEAKCEAEVALVAVEADAATAEATIWQQARAWHAEAVREAVEHAVSMALAGGDCEAAMAGAVSAAESRARLFHERHLQLETRSADFMPRAAASAERTAAAAAGAMGAWRDALEPARSGLDATANATEAAVQRRARIAGEESRLAEAWQFAATEEASAVTEAVAQALATAVPDAETKAAAAVRGEADAKKRVEAKSVASASVASVAFVQACQMLCCSVDAALRSAEAQEEASRERVYWADALERADAPKWPAPERAETNEGYAAARRGLTNLCYLPAGRVRVPSAGMGVVEQRVKEGLGLAHWEEARTDGMDAGEFGASVLQAATEAICDAVLEMSARAQAAHAECVACAARTALWHQRRASSIIHDRIESEGDMAVLRALARARREAEADCAVQLALERARCSREQRDAVAEAVARTHAALRQRADDEADASAESLAATQQALRLATARGEERRRMLKSAQATQLTESRVLSAEMAILEAESCHARQVLAERTVVGAAAAAELRGVGDAASASNGGAGRHANGRDRGAACKNGARDCERCSCERDEFGVSEKSLVWTPQTARSRSPVSTAGGRNGNHRRCDSSCFSSETLPGRVSPLQFTPLSDGGRNGFGGLRLVARGSLSRAARAASLWSGTLEQATAAGNASSIADADAQVDSNWNLGHRELAVVAALCVELRQCECELVEERLRADLLRGAIAEAEETAMEAAEAAAEAATMAQEAAYAAAAAAEAAMAHSAEQDVAGASNGSFTLESLLSALPKAEAMLLERNLLAIAHSVGIDQNCAHTAQSQRLHSAAASPRRRDHSHDQQRQRALEFDRSRTQHQHMYQREACQQYQQLQHHHEHQQHHQHQLLPPSSAPVLRGSGPGQRGGTHADHQKQGNTRQGRLQLRDNPAFSRLAGRAAPSGSTATFRPPH